MIRDTIADLLDSDHASDRGPLRFLHFGYGAGTLVRLLAHRATNSHHVAVELDQGVVNRGRYEGTET